MFLLGAQRPERSAGAGGGNFKALGHQQFIMPRKVVALSFLWSRDMDCDQQSSLVSDNMSFRSIKDSIIYDT